MSALLFAMSGFEPEGTWRHAGGMSQPEVACPAGQIETRTLRHEKAVICLPNHCFFNEVAPAGLMKQNEAAALMKE